MNPERLPVASELFAQWQRARGGRMEPAARPFSRGWEDLLEDARLVAATERAEAESDLRALAAEGWVTLKFVRYRPHLIERVVIPLEAEARWQAAFGFVAPTGEEARRIREFPWVPGLEFVREADLNLPFAELARLNEFLARGGRQCPVVPIKERSLQIFGEEKRLDSLLASALFRPGRLDLRADLRCELIGVPLAWRRGPATAAAQPVLVIENAATWHSYCRWNETAGHFSAVVYGDGNRFMDGIAFLAEIFRELGGNRPVRYFGDLDPHGLRIPQIASARALAMGLPAVEADAWSYGELLRIGQGQPAETDPAAGALCDWLGEWAEPARELFAKGQRLAQEHVGWERLSATPPMNTAAGPENPPGG